MYARECLEEDERASVQEQATSGSGALPREIITHIFEILQAGTAREGNPYSWLSVTLVCKAWRNTAYGSPSLWTHIDLSYPKEVVRSLLLMSEDAPLVVTGDIFGIEFAVDELGDRSSNGEEDDEGGHEEEDDDNDNEEDTELEIKIELVSEEQARIRQLDLRLSSSKDLMVPWKGILSSPWLILRTPRNFKLSS